MTMFDGLFKAGDWVLNHGGQVALDAAGFIPGVNVLTEGAESLYHGAHAANDYADGNKKEALVQGGEAAWHGGLAALNAVTGEGGALANEAAAGAKVIGEGANLAHAAGEGAELATEGATVAKEAAPGLLDMFGEGGTALKEGGEGLLSGIQKAAHITPKISETGLAGGLHLAADATELMVDTGVTIPKMMMPDAEKANEIPFMGGLPGLIVSAMAGVKNPEEKHEGGSE